MAIGLASDMKVYDDEFFGGRFEAIDQMVNKFNENSNNVLRIVPRESRGHFQRESYIKDLGATLITRRDITATTAVTPTAMAQEDEVRPKVNRKWVVENTLDSWRKIAQDQSEMSFRVGQQIGAQQFRDYLNTLIKVLVVTIEDVGTPAEKVVPLTPTQNVRYQELVDTLALFGDAAERIVAWVMHSSSAFALMQQSIQDKYEQVGGVTIITGNVRSLGRPIIVTDSPDLLEAGAPNTAKILGLQENAGVVIESEDDEIVSEVVTGFENLTFRIHGEYAYNVGSMGYRYTDATANPADAALTTPGNWAQAADHVKNTAGAMLIADDDAGVTP